MTPLRLVRTAMHDHQPAFYPFSSTGIFGYQPLVTFTSIPDAMASPSLPIPRPAAFTRTVTFLDLFPDYVSWSIIG
jgi:hypothetical protein